MSSSSTFPFTFDQSACSTCRGHCCRWGGYVWITEEEMMAIAVFKKMELSVFADSYVRTSYGRISLQERSINGEQICSMFDPYDRKCLIYDHRPSQCRTFPFWDQYRDEFKRLLDYCPGVEEKKGPGTEKG